MRQKNSQCAFTCVGHQHGQEKKKNLARLMSAVKPFENNAAIDMEKNTIAWQRC